MASDAQIRTSERKSRGFSVYSGLAQQAEWWQWDGYPGWRFCARVKSHGGYRGGHAITNAVDLAETVVKEGITKESIPGFEKRMEQRAKEKIEYSFENGRKSWKGREWYEYPEVDIRRLFM
jgi:hypothetical protein